MIAETGNSSLTTTTQAVDGASSNKVMYTQTFRINAGFAEGCFPDNGTITIN